MFIQRRASYMNLDGISAMNKKDLSSDLYFDLLKSALCASLYDESAWRRVDGPMKTSIDGASIVNKLVAKAKHAFLHFLRARNLQLVRTLDFNPEARDAG